MGHYACDMHPEWFEPDPPKREPAMSRKPSVILSAVERKAASNDLKSELARAKEQLKVTKDSYKAQEKELKLVAKDIAAYEKEIIGLQTRLAALKPAPKAAGNSLSFQTAR